MNPSKLLSISGKSTAREICRQSANARQLLDYANVQRKDKTFCDVTIEVGKEKFPAHRMVLSCYSNFFERMFKTEMKEKCEDSVQIKDMDEITMKSLIEFMYTGSININADNVCSLLDAAEFTQLQECKQFCFDFLESAISAESCFIIHELSDRYGNDELKVKVKKFIDDNFAKVVSKDEFKNLPKSEVEICISNQDKSKVSVATIYRAIVGWTRFDLGNRRSYFPDLLKLVDLFQLSLVFLEDVVSNEELITENFQCTKLVLQSIVNCNKTMRIKEGGSKILSLGTARSLSKCKEIFNLLNEPVKEYPDLLVGRRCSCSVVLDNYVYFIGGKTHNNDSLATNLVHRMNLKDKVLKWEEVASLSQKRFVMGAAVLNGLIFVVGGAKEESEFLSTGEYFTPEFNQWQNIAPLKQKRSGNALVSCKGFIYAIGGYGNNTYLDTVERFQPGSEAWNYVTPLQVPRRWLAVVVIDDVIYAIGGQSGIDKGTTLKSVEKYDLTNKTWSYVKEMNFERSSPSACVLRGKIYVSGGLDKNKQVVKSTECYDPSCGKWKIVAEVEDGLFHHAIVAI